MTKTNQHLGRRNTTFHRAFAATPGVTSQPGVTNTLEEKMETRQSRLGVWALVLFTCFAIFGGQSAFAWDSTKQRVEVGGWICKPDANGPSGCAEVKIGLTAKINKMTMPDGRFEYLNRLSHFSVRGHINAFSVNSQPKADSSNPCYAAAIFNGTVQVAGPSLTAPQATVDGSCDDGSCTFHATFVDDDSSNKATDWVCNPQMTGTDKKGVAENYMTDPGEPLQRGRVEIHPATVQ